MGVVRLNMIKSDIESLSHGFMNQVGLLERIFAAGPSGTGKWGEKS